MVLSNNHQKHKIILIPYTRGGRGNTTALFMKISITIPGCVAANGATINNERILVTTGFSSDVHNLSTRCCIPTARPYHFLSSCGCNGGLLALSNKCGNKIHVLNCDLEELYAITPNTNDGPVQSVFIYPDGSGLLLTYRKRCYKSNVNGRILSVIGSTEGPNVDFLQCIPVCTGFLLAAEENGQTVLKLLGLDDGNVVLPRCTKFKSFVNGENGTVYALLGKGYPFTYLAPVYENCTLLPITTDTCSEVFCTAY